METLNYTNFITAVATETGFTKKDTKEVIDAAAKVITDQLAAGNEVKFANLGKFTTAISAGRTGIIQMGDRKGETYTTEDKRVPKFKASKNLKDAVKEV